MNDIGGVMRTLDLMRSNLAVDIAKALGARGNVPDRPGEAPAPDAYGAAGRRGTDDLAGLKLPSAILDTMDLETVQTLFKNVVTTNPQLAQGSIANAMTALHEAPNQPGDAAARQGLAKDDAAQLAATKLSADRLRDNPMPLSQQVTGSGSRAELWDGWKAVQLPVLQPDASAIQQALVANNVPAAALGFNAAMLTGLPFHRQQFAAMLGDSKVSEEDVLNYLAALGADDEFLKKFRKSKTAIGKKLLIYLAMLLNALETVAQTMANELAALSGEEKSVQESREQANSRGHGGPRRHVYVE